MRKIKAVWKRENNDSIAEVRDVRWYGINSTTEVYVVW